MNSRTPYRIAYVLVVTLALSARGASAQSNFSFRVGAAGIIDRSGQVHMGPNVGIAGKFNVLPVIRVRSQFDVDRIQMNDIHLDGYDGDQTMTYVSLGIGVELGAGSHAVNVFACILPHGTIRTTIRALQDDRGRPRIESVTRFSVGFVTGAGIEFYLSDNIGFEALGQFLVYNFDSGLADPSFRGFRLTGGVQFYIGRNFVRP